MVCITHHEVQVGDYMVCIACVLPVQVQVLPVSVKQLFNNLISYTLLMDMMENSLKLFFCRFLSVMGFVINIDTLMVMIPELLQVQKYVLTYRFSQDHLELLFNSIRASGRVDVLLITIHSESILDEYLSVMLVVCMYYVPAFHTRWLE